MNSDIFKFIFSKIHENYSKIISTNNTNIFKNQISNKIKIILKENNHVISEQIVNTYILSIMYIMLMNIVDT